MQTKMTRLVGGIDQHDKPADSEVQQLVAKIKSEIENNLGRQFSTFTAESYRTQLVNGVNYFIKLHVGDETTRLHIRAYQPFKGEPTFVSHLPDRAVHEPLGYF